MGLQGSSPQWSAVKVVWDGKSRPWSVEALEPPPMVNHEAEEGLRSAEGGGDLLGGGDLAGGGGVSGRQPNGAGPGGGQGGGQHQVP